MELLELRLAPSVSSPTLSYPGTAASPHTLGLEVNGPDLLLVDSSNPSNVLLSQALADTTSVDITGNPLGGNTLTVDFSGGDFTIAGGIHFDGVSGTLIIKGSGGQTGSYTPSSVPGAGSVAIDGNTITFDNLTPVEVSGVATWTVNTPTVSDSLTIGASTAPSNPSQSAVEVSGDSGFEAVYLYNVGTLNVNTPAASNDTVDIAGVNFTAASVTNLNLDTGSDGTDTITLGTGTTTLTGSLGISTSTSSTVNVDAAVSAATIAGNASAVNVAATGQIQTGIDLAASGATVNVAAGTYVENLVIPQSLILAGAGAGSTIIEPSVSDVTKSLVLVRADNVTIHDVTLEGNNPSISSGHTSIGVDTDAGAGILVNTSAAHTGLVVYNNTVQDFYSRGIMADMVGGGTYNIHDNNVSNIAGTESGIGIFGREGSGVITHNVVDTMWDGIDTNFSHGTVISNNAVVHAGTAGFTDGNAAIHSDNYGGAGISGPEVIENNTVSNGGQGSIGIWAFMPYGTVTIQGNTISGVDVGLASFGGTATGLARFLNNSVSTSSDGGANTEQYGAYVTTDTLGNGTFSANAVFTGNKLAGNNYGLVTAQPGAPAATLTVTAYDNDLSGNAMQGINNPTGTLVDASGNWWGTNTPDGVAAAAGTNVDYTPWLDTGANSAVGAGFQGDFSSLDVSAASPQAGTVGPIQEGINDVTAGGTVNVENGTYAASNILVAKSVTIHGQSESGVVISPDGTDSHDNSTYGGTALQGFVIEASHVDIDHLTINGGAGQNFRQGILADSSNGWSGANGGTLTVDQVTVNNVFRKGIALYSRSGLTTGNAITNNTFDSVGTSSVNAFESAYAIADFSSSGTISGNVITNAGIGIGTNYLSGNPADGPVLTITSNQISAPSTTTGHAALGMDLSGLADGSVVSGNTIDMTGGSGHDLGLIVQYAIPGGAVSVQSNNITIDSGDTGIYLYQNSDSTHPSLIDHNTITGSSAATGILVTDDGTLFGEPSHASTTYASLTGNIISGVAVGVEVAAAGGLASVTLGGGSIFGNAIGIDVNGGSATISASQVYDNGTGIQVTGGGSLTSATLNAITNNTADGILVTASAGSIGTIMCNDLSGDGPYGVENQNATMVDASKNYWGSPSGPTSPQNPVGTGVPVSTNVLFSPFATDAACTMFSTPLVAITTSTLSSGSVGFTYNQTITAIGGTGTLTFSSTAGTLPTGLTLTTDGVLSGSPTVAGTYVLTLTATDAVGNSAIQSYVMIINPGVAITTTTLASGAVGNTFGQSISATGGTGALTFTATGTLPSGLTLSESGLLSGTPVTAGSYAFTVTATDAVGASASQSYTLLITATSKYQVTIVGAGTVQAGTPILVVVQAVDASGNPVTSYSGPAIVTISVSSTNAGSTFPTTVVINSFGLGFFAGTLTQVGSYTITASNSSFTGSSTPVTVTPGVPVKLAFASQPVNTPTETTLPPVTVQVQDLYGNLVTSDNADMVTVSIASGPGSFTTGSTTTASVHNGVATFGNLTVVTPGTYTLSALVPQAFSGPNSTSFVVAPLQVVPGSFAANPAGFSLQFNAPFLVNSLTPVLYGQGFGSAAPSPSVIVTTDPGNLSDTAAYVEGSLILDTATNSITFVATNTAYQTNTGSPILPDGTYTVIVRSNSATNGFQTQSTGGGFLDGLGSGTPGSGDFTATFTVSAAAAGDDVVWVPATADGPGQPLSAPGMNQAGGGYPVYLNDNTGTVTSVTFTFNYDPALLTVTGATSNGNIAGSTFSYDAALSTPGHAVLEYTGGSADPTQLRGGQVALGFITASVPGGTMASPMPYKAKDLLTLTGLTVSGTDGPISAVTSGALHLVAYVGDADGNGSYSSNDAVLITRTALQADSGFTAFPLVDPVIVADTDGSGFLAADVALQVNEAGVGVATANLPSPPIPAGVSFQPIANNVDPSLTLASDPRANDGTMTVVVNIDDAHPAGSTGLTEAHLALTYDPRAFTVSAADVHLGSMLAEGSGWSIVPTIDQTTGQIAIALSSATPISSSAGGSLVTIDFHPLGRVSNPSPVELVPSASPNGQDVRTELEDAQGTFTLTIPPATSMVTLARTGSTDAAPVQGWMNPASTSDIPAGLVAVQSDDNGAVQSPALDRAAAAMLPEASDQEVVDSSTAPVEAASAHAGVAVVHSESAVVAGTSSLAPSSVAAPIAPPLTGLVFQLSSTPLMSAQGSGGAGWQHLADQLFQALGRTSVNGNDPSLVGAVQILEWALADQLLLSQRDSLNRLNWDDASSDLDWRGADAQPVRGERALRPAPTATMPDAARARAALDQVFAQTDDDTDLSADDV
jgi:hypothetical protein